MKDALIMTRMPWNILAVSVLAALLVSPAAAQQQRPPTNVVTAFASEEYLAPQLQVPGTVISRNDSRISAEISGRVDSIAEVGTIIEAGQPIAQMDRRLLELQLEENEASMRSLEASLRYQRAEVGRLRELAERNNAPASRVEEAVSNMEVAQQQLVQARVTRDRTQYNLDRTSILAPFTGRVVERLIEPGEYASTGTVVARLVDTDHIEVVAQAPVSVVGYLDGVDSLLVSIGDRLPIEAPIRAIIPVGDQVTRTFEIRVDLAGMDAIIGVPVRVAVPNDDPRQVVAVPRDALVLRAEGTFVYRVSPENTAERLQVQVGAASGDLVEVRGAVVAGDQVVIRGAEFLGPGGQTLNIEGAS